MHRLARTRLVGFAFVGLIASALVSPDAQSAPASASAPPIDERTSGAEHGPTHRWTLDPDWPTVPLRSEGAQVDELEALLAALPAAADATAIVLQPADVGADFLVVSRGVAIRPNESICGQSLVRGGKFLRYVEMDGVLSVRTYAVAAPDVGAADRAFDEIASAMGEGAEEVPVPVIADRARGFVAWGTFPSDLGIRAIVFRSGAVAGLVLTRSYEPPTTVDDVIPLAQIVIGRARG